MRKQTFENRIEDCLKAQGLTADQVEKYGNLVSIKVKKNRQKLPAKQFAWRLLEALPGSEVYDILPEVTGIDQEQYMIVRLSVSEPAVVELKKPHTQSMEVPPMMTIDFDQHDGPMVLGPDSSHILATDEPAEPAKKAKGVRPAKAKADPTGSFADQGKTPEVGAVAWVLVKKKGGGLKQARCQVLDANETEAVVFENPGVWKAELCRIKHNVPSTPEWIAYCGLCSEYANPRKRARAAALGPELPGFEGMGAYTLHSPCSNRALTWIRKTLTRWSKRGVVSKEPGSIIPDSRQARGWDFGTRVYHSEEEFA